MKKMNGCCLAAKQMIIKTAAPQRQSFCRENKVLIEYCTPHPDAAALACAYGMRGSLGEVSDSIEESEVKKVLRRRQLGFSKADTQLQLTVMRHADVLVQGLQNGHIERATLHAVKQNLNTHPEQKRLLFLCVVSQCDEAMWGEAYPQALRLNAVFAGKCLMGLFEILEQVAEDAAPAKAQHAVEQENQRLSSQLSQRSKEVLSMRDEVEALTKKNRAEAQLQLMKMLNDEKYGCILDLLQGTRSAFQQMRKQNQVVPFELKCAQTLTRRLLEFVEDCNISNILEVGEQMPLSATEVDGYLFEGTPFHQENEVKQVRVVASGWQWTDDETVVIAPPRVREEAVEAVEEGVK